MSSSKWTFCVCLLTCLLNWSVSEVKTVQPGEDVLLPCQGPRGADIIFVQWIRPDLKSEGFVFFFRDDRTYENYQHPSFHGRVELRDPQMKDGDTSVILKNVSIKDTGTYECYIRIKGSRSELINSFHLKVKDSDQQQVTVKTGDDVTLQCLDHRGGDIELLEWRRQDLEKDVFVWKNGTLFEDPQHPSFKNPVELRDPEMKDGDVSVILKNVNISDAGTYECYVAEKGSSSQLITTINLTVAVSGGEAGGTEDGEDEDGGKQSDYFGVAGAVSVIVMQVAVIVFVILRKVIKQHLYKPHFKQAGLYMDQEMCPEQQFSARLSHHATISFCF